MADIHAATSTYDSGTNDTYTPVVDNTDEVLDDHQNGPASAIIAIETILGTGTTLKGSAADLVARLAVALEANGKIKDLSATTKTTFPPTTDEGCAGDVTANFTASQILRKHASLSKFETTGYTVPGSSGVVVSEADTQTLTNKTLSSSTLDGTVIATPPALRGTASGSSYVFGGTILNPTTSSGIIHCDTFTLNSGNTNTVNAGSGRLVVIANTSITIGGTIDASGAGAPLATAVGDVGTDQAGGGGGSGTGGGDAGSNGGAAYTFGADPDLGWVSSDWVTVRSGGAGASGGPNGNGATPTQITGLGTHWSEWVNVFGGAAGGGGFGATGSNGKGGAGGASIVLIAPLVTLEATAVLNTSGDNGQVGTGTIGGGGGGAAGNVYIAARVYTDSGATFTMSAGNGGSGVSLTGNGGNGQSGVKYLYEFA